MRFLSSFHRGYRGLVRSALALAPLTAFGLTIPQSESVGPSQVASLPSASSRWDEIGKAEDPSFRRHVIPLMSRAGCSGRECHGAFSGQGGFQLSLFGYDFEKDHQAINAESENGFRVDAAHPTDSLILLKSTNQEKHKGKERIKKGSWEYNLLLKWVQSGAKNDTEATGAFDRLEVEPKEVVFGKPGDSTQLRVLAHWMDGTIEDVTQLTRFRTNDESVAEVSATGLVSCKEKGDTHIVAFYDNGVQPVPAMLPASVFTGSEFPQVPVRTKVDELVVNKLRKAGIVPSEICTDAEFLRRASLDMAATLPTPEQVRAFLADNSPDKRTRKIEELLKTPGYAAWWTTLLCDYSGNNPQLLFDAGGLIRGLNGDQSRRWYDWIYKRVSENTPYDQLAAGIALGTSRTSSEQNYEEFAKEMGACFRTESPEDFAMRETMPFFWARRNVAKAEEKALAFAHTFLGVRIECAQCHKHPFDQWTKQDFEQFQAFFSSVAHGPRRAQDSEVISNESLTREIREKVAVETGGEISDKKNEGQRLTQKEAMRRIRAGELVPWNEVYVDTRRDGRANKKKKQEIDGAARVITPKILGGEEVMLQQYSDPRQPLVDWMRAKDNPYFARSFVNRVWAVYFGRGIVEPADDMNLANPPSNRELMEFLADGFVKSGYDMKWVHRTIANSDTYQRSWRTTPSNKLDDKNFSHARIRRLPAELVLDSIAIATESAAGQAKFVADLASRAVGPNATVSGKAKGSDSYSLKTFGKPPRDMNCDCERTTDPTLLQTIFIRNDPALLQLLDAVRRDGPGWIEQLRREASAEFSPEQLRADLAKFEANKQRAIEGRAKRDDDPAVAERRREKKEQEITELDARILRTRAELDRAQQRKPVDFDRAIEEVFLRTVTRLPTPAEFAKAKQRVAEAQSPVNGVRELLWAMLNTREFMVNH